MVVTGAQHLVLTADGSKGSQQHKDFVVSSSSGLCVCVRAVNCGSMWTVSMEICNAWPTLQQPIQPPLNNF